MRWSESDLAAHLTRQGSPLPPETREAQFQAHVVRLAKELGLLAYHTHDSRHSAAGYPDLCIVDPRPLGERGPGGGMQGMPYVYIVELKTANGKLSHAQEIWLRSLHGKTVVSEVWRPSGMAEIVKKLKGEG
jgi:hypothetical protein